MKISAQEKIAELEGRIAVLEKEVKDWKRRAGYIPVVGPAADAHWKAMWHHFGKFFARVFK